MLVPIGGRSSRGLVCASRGRPPVLDEANRRKLKTEAYLGKIPAGTISKCNITLDLATYAGSEREGEMPLGQICAIPFALQLEHGTSLEHLALVRRHSAQDIRGGREVMPRN